ncbi:MAG: hypothetical protein II498_07125 [Ruminococcus sp.]|nr:hypothetical protein [uncultured Ruminococcus sp.]MBQ2428313.1 hypothetical protein [Ruminococcus sp.]MBQ2443103.1 hypothetical protein [Ruminococcus sp.]MDO4893107.1 hypothetical protein [Eubacteriales bacterium]
MLMLFLPHLFKHAESQIRYGIGKSAKATITSAEAFVKALKNASENLGALDQLDGVKYVDFDTVLGQGHTEAERTGNSTENFIAWVNECMKAG